MTKEDQKFIKKAIELAHQSMQEKSGGPFGAIVVKDGQVIAQGQNKVTASNDPTAHAEVVAIRNACSALGQFQLTGCVVYSSCEPCPMCLGAIYWARPMRLVFACGREDAAAIDFDDDFIYQELTQPHHLRTIPTEQILQQEGLQVFKLWQKCKDKVLY